MKGNREIGQVSTYLKEAREREDTYLTLEREREEKEEEGIRRVNMWKGRDKGRSQPIYPRIRERYDATRLKVGDLTNIR